MPSFEQIAQHVAECIEDALSATASRDRARRVELARHGVRKAMSRAYRLELERAPGPRPEPENEKPAERGTIPAG
jgi:hypothetical protein